MSDEKIFISLRSIERVVEQRSWIVEITYQSSIFSGAIRDPFSEDDERKLQYHFTDYYRVDPFDKSGASLVVNSLLRYASSLLDQLKEIVGDLDFRSQSCILQIVTTHEDASIHRLHWESLEHPDIPARFAICRVCKSDEPKDAVDETASKLNLLFLTARKIGVGVVDVDHRPVLNSFLEVIAHLPRAIGVDFEVVRPGSIDGLVRILKAKGEGFYDLLHLDVHGRIGSTNEAELLFLSSENSQELVPVTATRLGRILQEYGVRSVFLNACDSAKVGSHVESNLAASLLKAGVQNVVGMAYDLNISAAEVFVREFYESLLMEQLHMATATARGRHALQQMKSRRARFKQHVDLEDWIIPVFYSAIEGPPFDRVSLKPPTTSSDPKASKMSLISIRDFPRQEATLFGRDSDLLRLETCLIQHRCVEVNGAPGVGTTSLVKQAAAWWKHTKLIKRFKYCDMWGTDHETAQGVDDNDDEDLQLTTLLTLLNSSGVLLIIDQMDYGGSDAEGIEEINTIAERCVERVSRSTNNYLIIITSTATGVHKGFHTITIDPLTEIHSMELAFQTSPKLRAKAMSNREEYYLFGRFLRSLSGNCLAIVLFASYLERLADFSIRRFVTDAWTTKLHKEHQALLNLICQSRIVMSISAFDSGYDVGPKDLPSLWMLAFCRERISEDFIKHIEEQSPPELRHGTDQSDEAPASETHESVGVDSEVSEFPLRTILKKFRSLSLATNDTEAKTWTLHPLLPYLIQEIWLTNNIRETARSVFADTYIEMSYEWLVYLDETESIRKSYDNDLIVSNLNAEGLNFILAAWETSQDNSQPCFLLEPLITGLISLHAVESDNDLHTLAALAAMCHDRVSAYTFEPMYTRAMAHIRSLFSSTSSSRKKSQELHEVGLCSCQRHVLFMEQLVWLGQYYMQYDVEGSELRNIMHKTTVAVTNMSSILQRADHEPNSGASFQNNQAKTQLAVYAIVKGDFAKARIWMKDISNKDITIPLFREIGDRVQKRTLALLNHSEGVASSETTSEDLESLAFTLQQTTEELAESYNSASNILGVEAFRTMGDFSGAALRIRDDPTDLYAINPMMASAMELLSTTNRSLFLHNGNDAPRTLPRRSILSALESFSSSSYIEAQYNTHLNLAMSSRENDQARALFHFEEAMKILSNGNFLADEERVGWLRLMICKAAHAVGDNEKAANQVCEVYKTIKLPTNKVSRLVLLAFTIYNLKFMEQAVPEITSRYEEYEADAQMTAIAWTSATWESQIYKSTLAEDPEFGMSIRSSILEARNGGVMWDMQLWAIQNDGESDNNHRDRLAKYYLMVSKLIGCKPTELKSFLEKQCFKTLNKAVAQDLATLGIGPRDDFEYDQMTQSKIVCLEAEKIIFAPASERKNFVWFDKKYEKKGFRTWWPTGQ